MVFLFAAGASCTLAGVGFKCSHLSGRMTERSRECDLAMRSHSAAEIGAIGRLLATYNFFYRAFIHRGKGVSMYDRRFAFMMAAALTLSAGGTAFADRYVSTHGDDAGNNCANPSPACRTIGAALAVAASGEAINVAAGNYKENLVTGRLTDFSLIVQGGWDDTFTVLNVTANKTVLSGGKTDRALKITSDGTTTQSYTLDGLTIEKSTAVSPDSEGEKGGGGILVESHDGSVLTLELDQVTLDKNKGEGGGGLRLLALDSSTLTANV